MKWRSIHRKIRRRLFKKTFLKDKRYPPYWFDSLLCNAPAVIVQIGSNDGKTGDPIYPLLQKNKEWRALFVEPVPYLFEQLKQNYPDVERFAFENVAITKGEQRTFYWVDPTAKKHIPDLPYWYDQLGSFDKQHILKHFDGGLEPFIIANAVEGIDLRTLFDRNQIGPIDILHIDTEGYDWQILQQLDISRHNPKFILFEANHLSDAVRSAALDFLRPHYDLISVGIDILAVRRKLDPTFVKRINTYFLKRKQQIAQRHSL